MRKGVSDVQEERAVLVLFEEGDGLVGVALGERGLIYRMRFHDLAIAPEGNGRHVVAEQQPEVGIEAEIIRLGR